MGSHSSELVTHSLQPLYLSLLLLLELSCMTSTMSSESSSTTPIPGCDVTTRRRLSSASDDVPSSSFGNPSNLDVMMEVLDRIQEKPDNFEDEESDEEWELRKIIDLVQ